MKLIYIFPIVLIWLLQLIVMHFGISGPAALILGWIGAFVVMVLIDVTRRLK